MKAKQIVSVVLLLFVVASVVLLVVGETRAPSKPPEGASALPTNASEEVDQATTSKTESAEPARKTIAYYFHSTARCKTCLTIEAYAQEALAVAFPEELESGRLEWRAVDTDEPENEHFISDYELTASSLVLVDFIDGKQVAFRILDDVWTLVDDELKFKAYVEGEALAYLGSGD